jgi:hypothetical protein
LDLARYALTGCVAAALLAGCGGSQPPIGAPGAMPQTSAIATHVEHGGSWMAPEAKSEKLIYIGTLRGDIYVFTYPNAQFVTSFFPPEQTNISGLCTDSAGDVYAVGSFNEAWLFKYLHGATTPVTTIKLGGYFPSSCSVDPTTGNVAVLMTQFSKTYVAIFPSGSGSATFYTVPNTQEEHSFSCAYDNRGNLFLDVLSSDDGWELAELPAGSNSFTAWPLNGLRLGDSSLQWTSPYFVVSDHGTVYRLSVSDSKVTVAGSTRALLSRGTFWIQGDRTLIADEGPKNKQNRVTQVALWKYRKGGNPFKVIQRVDKTFIYFSSIIVSSGPSH